MSIELGGVPQVQEAVRDTWIWRWLDALARDVRYATRSMTRSWGFALGASAVLALAIGGSTAIFSVVNTVLLQPLGYPDADRIVSVETLWTNTGRVNQSVSGPDFLDWQAQNDVFEKMAVYYSGDTGGHRAAARMRRLAGWLLVRPASSPLGFVSASRERRSPEGHAAAQEVGATAGWQRLPPANHLPQCAVTFSLEGGEPYSS